MVVITRQSTGRIIDDGFRLSTPGSGHVHSRGPLQGPGGCVFKHAENKLVKKGLCLATCGALFKAGKQGEKWREKVGRK